MSPWAAFKEGTGRIWFHKRLLLWLYLINLLFAAVLVFPFRNIVSKISNTDLADDFLSGFPLGPFAAFWSQHSLEFKSLAFSAAGLGILYLIANIFLAGGIVATLMAERRVSLRRFCNGAIRYFFRYLRLFVALVVVIGLVLTGYNFLLAEFVEDLQERATNDVASFLWGGLNVLVILVLVSLILMVFDYAKIRTVVDSRRSMIVATASAFAFSVRRCVSVVALFYLNLLVVGLLFVIYLLVENQFSNATTISMVSLFIIQQIFILSRIWMKLSFFSTQLTYYQSAGKTPLPGGADN